MAISGARRGKSIGEEHGETVGFRVLPDEGKGQWVEVSQRAKGKLLGLDSTDLLTYRFTIRPDGSLYGDGQGIQMLSDGSMSAWAATGIGSQSVPGGPQSWKVTLQFHNPMGRYKELEGHTIHVDFDVSADWKTAAKVFDSA